MKRHGTYVFPAAAALGHRPWVPHSVMSSHKLLRRGRPLAAYGYHSETVSREGLCRSPFSSDASRRRSRPGRLAPVPRAEWFRGLRNRHRPRQVRSRQELEDSRSLRLVVSHRYRQSHLPDRQRRRTADSGPAWIGSPERSYGAATSNGRGTCRSSKATMLRRPRR
jgi:hypothetical protein